MSYQAVGAQSTGGGSPHAALFPTCFRKPKETREKRYQRFCIVKFLTLTNGRRSTSDQLEQKSRLEKGLKSSERDFSGECTNEQVRQKAIVGGLVELIVAICQIVTTSCKL